jgi:uncharacterized phage protein gp47/JayE
MTNFDLTSRDYDTIKTDLLARAGRVFPEWTDRDTSDFGMLFVDLWASMADVLHYYIDRVAGEAFLATATQRESVLAFANLMDYVPSARSSAVVIPQYTEFIARVTDTTYQSYAPVGGTVPALGTLTLQLLEGTIVIEETLTTSTNGLAGQRYPLRNEGAVGTSVRVFVYEDGVTATEYQHVPRLATSEAGARVFVLNTAPTGETEVVFGNSSNGLPPPAGSRVTSTYAFSRGADGNMPANSVVGFRTTTPVGVSTGNSTAFTGGTNDESISSMKRSIPAVVSAQNRAVTAEDFVALALQVVGVGKAAISYAPGDLTHNASVTMYPQAFVSDWLTSSAVAGPVTAQMQTDIVAAIQPRALLGVTVRSATSIDWTPIYVAATVYVNERFVSNWVFKDVAAAIDELFDYDNVFFGQRLSLGQLYQIILNVPGVDYANVTRFDTNPAGTAQPSIMIDYPVLGSITPTPKLPKKGNVSLTMSGGISTS